MRQQRHRFLRNISSRINLLPLGAGLLLAVAGCNGVPSYVLSPEDMAQLLADIHLGESVIDQNYSTYRDTEAKEELRLSIYRRHGVTAAQVDTSMMWYGHNLQKYNEVYDRTIEILEERSTRVQTTAMNQAMAMAGDSVDVWNASRHITVSSTAPSEYLTFALDRDENWEAGDVYSWRMKTHNNADNLTLTLMVDYADGVVEQNYVTAATDGWHSIVLVTDSTRTPVRIHGYTRLRPPHHGTQLYIDSISLTRSRVSPDKYPQRFRLRTFGEIRKPKLPDKDATNNTPPEPLRALDEPKLQLVED